MSEEVKQDVVDETTENTVNDAENTVDAGAEAVVFLHVGLGVLRQAIH